MEVPAVFCHHYGSQSSSMRMFASQQLDLLGYELL